MSNKIMRSVTNFVLLVASLPPYVAAQADAPPYLGNQPVLVGSETASISSTSPLDYFPQVTEEDERSTYLQWIEETSNSYSRNTFLPSVANPNNGAAVFWNLYADSIDTSVARSTPQQYTHIQVAVAVRATGWVGFGISEAGGMLGSDMALFETEHPSSVKDAYVLEDFAHPKLDDCHHWTLLNVQNENGWLIVELSRPFDTQDMQDHAIVDDSAPMVVPTRLIAAWGDSPTVSYHGLNVGKISTKIFPTVDAQTGSATETDVVPAANFEKRMEEESDGYFEVVAANYSIPAQETTYHYVCKSFEELRAEFDLPAAENETLTLVANGAVLSPDTKQYVHHFIVYGHAQGNLTAEQCGPSADMLAGWAPGEQPMSLPKDVGITIGPGTPFNTIVVEIHYNNPGKVTNLVDSSGFRVYYSIQPRATEAAFMSVGDPGVQLFGEPIADGLTEYQFYCASDCTSLVLDEPVTVIAESLHMHQTGVRMTNELIRSGEVVNYAGVEVFDFDQQGSFAVQQKEYQIMAGDEFRTTCYYRDGTQFGAGSQEEMCMAFVLYYPSKKIDFGSFGSLPWSCYYGIEQLPVCKEELQFQTLKTEDALGRRFGTPSSVCKMGGEDALAGDSNENASAASAKCIYMGFLLVASVLVGV
jgi:hypothetical protein